MFRSPFQGSTPRGHTELCSAGRKVAIWTGVKMVPWGSCLLQLLSPAFCHIELNPPPYPSKAVCALSLSTITCIIEGLIVSLTLSFLSILKLSLYPRVCHLVNVPCIVSAALERSHGVNEKGMREQTHMSVSIYTAVILVWSSFLLSQLCSLLLGLSLGSYCPGVRWSSRF